jgi:membrane-bound serine protease (ClpP class)
VLGVAAVVALVAGGLLLFDTDSEALKLSVPIAIAVGVTLGGLVLFGVAKALKVRRAPVRGATEHLVGHAGTVREALDPLGQVLVAGELWRARTADEAPLAPGARVRVAGVDGLTLTVEADKEEAS